VINLTAGIPVTGCGVVTGIERSRTKASMVLRHSGIWEIRPRLGVKITPGANKDRIMMVGPRRSVRRVPHILMNKVKLKQNKKE
jgi:hypothetical protein